MATLALRLNNCLTEAEKWKAYLFCEPTADNEGTPQTEKLKLSTRETDASTQKGENQHVAQPSSSSESSEHISSSQKECENELSEKLKRCLELKGNGDSAENSDSAPNDDKFDSPFNDAPFPSSVELDSFEEAVLSCECIYDNKYIDSFILAGSFILLIRSKLPAENFKDFILASALLSWSLLEESFHFHNSIEDRLALPELRETHRKLFFLLSRMKWRAHLDVTHLNAILPLFQNYPYLMRDRKRVPP